MSVYLDYSATTPIDDRVLEIMIDVYRNHTGNSDSRTHDYGDQARQIVETARKQVSSLLKVKSDEVFFTSGATESNNIALQGLIDYADKSEKKHIITTAIEHKAVLETVKHMEKMGFTVDIIYPQNNGMVSVDEVKDKIRENTLVVSVMHVNNETGIIQPVDQIGSILKERNILFHVDATQSCGKLVDELRLLNYDLLSFSAHKLRGPQGIGCLIMRRKNYKLPPVKSVYYGGQQEKGIRPGTVPVALVAGCGKACEIAEIEYSENERKTKDIKRELNKLLEQSGINYSFNGDQNNCISNATNIHLKGVASEALMLSTKQYCSISNGSACTSNNYAPSYVLKAMGIPEEDIMESFRVSWGSDTDIELFRENFSKLLDVAKSFI